MFGVAAAIATLSIFAVAYVRDPILVVLLLSSTVLLPALVRHVMGDSGPPPLPGPLGLPRGCMNFASNIAGIVGLIVQAI